ncbi:ABC transporter ATP-binding protein [Peribacillus frigoritolerans]|uniref:ABC transporter ATP-binding protein n=1 Tax=Peribacillus frigoritolerans TaxID=450367 RepID=UPI000BED24BD|nr:ABC transporter ATP-binding protein [Peribacillus frigoritolerans]PEF39703.1 Fe3+/spermidine/putrescine ABC transporter ATP-binding protein [Bacillus sp. AFS094228]PEO44751.1 Fe3+/spermidine/putrescine ABC transporter ATP-binding protein [Bacillus sp. AFS026049]MED3832276.1 ABC transporter ATP-binding protein [Peribacillus frigoritolerans]MED3847085.1 ABC transporter ATP-binding protein [Peribacillus frigoritolerans]ULM99450.1 ABC transporter ATP-binding protein [Peribacillus frigoritoleran
MEVLKKDVEINRQHLEAVQGVGSNKNDVEIKGAFKQFGANVVLNGIDLEVKQGELLTLLGPSGCGKSTTLNLIAGFLDPDRGEVHIKGNNVTKVPPYKRDLGMVFQTYSLFPHMTVYENLSFGLKLRKVGKAEQKKKISKALELVKMSGLENRYPRELSGGQRQRVAISRALVVEPELLLLDEPLSNLDAKLRHELRAEIKRLQKEIGVTTIFVTHDQEEALSMSDRVVVMNAGKIEQISTPTEIYNHPKTEFVFQFIGKSNCFEGNVSAIDKRKVAVKIGSDITYVDTNNVMGNESDLKTGDEVKLYIRPEKLQIVSLDEKSSSPLDFHRAKISQMNYLGTSWEINVLLQGKSIQVLTSAFDSSWQNGSEVLIGWSPSEVMLVKK